MFSSPFIPIVLFNLLILQIEIKRVLESLYGFEVEKVQTLNMDGKKKQRGGILLAKPNYKKAFVTLRTPLSISPDLFPIKVIEDDKKELNRQSKTSIVEAEGQKRSHWLEGNGNRPDKTPHRHRGYAAGGSLPPRRRGRAIKGPDETVKFPWTSMKRTTNAAR